MSSQYPQQSAAPGWYATPDPSQERYWDGQRWTDAYRPRLTHPPYAPAVAASMVPGQSAPNHGPAIASMVLGICSLVVWYLGIVTGIIGLVLGVVSLKHCQPNGPKRGRGMAIAGIVCSIVALALWLLIILIAVTIDSRNY